MSLKSGTGKDPDSLYYISKIVCKFLQIQYKKMTLLS